MAALKILRYAHVIVDAQNSGGGCRIRTKHLSRSNTINRLRNLDEFVAINIENAQYHQTYQQHVIIIFRLNYLRFHILTLKIKVYPTDNRFGWRKETKILSLRVDPFIPGNDKEIICVKI